MRRGGYTLVELFVVIAVTALIISIAVPATVRLVDSQRRSESQNAVIVATRVARDIAIRDGEDTGAVFLRDIRPGRGPEYRIVIAQRVGSFDDLDASVDPFSASSVSAAVGGGGRLAVVNREVFAAVEGAPVGRISAGYSARGWLPAFSMQPLGGEFDAERTWYDSFAQGQAGTAGTAGTVGGVQVELEDSARVGHWVEPESGYFDASRAGGAWGAQMDRTPRSSFMVRFEGGTGRLMRSFVPALVVDPRAAVRSNVGGGPGERYDIDPRPAELAGVDRDWWKAERADSEMAWARAVLGATAAAFWGPTATTTAQEVLVRRSQLIGLYSNDTVLCGPATRLAVYRESDFLAGVNGVIAANGGAVAVSLDRATGTIYRAFGPAATGAIAFEASPDGAQAPAIREAITSWVEGDTDGDGVLFDQVGLFDEDDEPRAAIFTIDASTGDLREVVR